MQRAQEGKTRDTPSLRCDIDVKLHLRMDAAEHQERACGREADFDCLARLLRPGIEVQRGIEYAYVMGSGVVVDDPQSAAAPKRHMGGVKGFVVLGHRADLLRWFRWAAFHCCNRLWQCGLPFARQRAEECDQIRVLRL